MDKPVFVVPPHNYWNDFPLIVVWIIISALFARFLWRFARTGRALVAGSSAGMKFWSRTVALMVVLSALLGLSVLAYLIPNKEEFETFRLPADEISRIRIDVYGTPADLGESQWIKTTTVDDPDQITRIIQLLTQSSRYRADHEHVVGRTYLLRFMDMRTAEWRGERVELCPLTDRGPRRGIQRNCIVNPVID